MSRYKLKNYQSVYRDPGSVAINTLQRQRFQQAFNADDALAGAVDQMTAADFAGDQALKADLENRTRQELQNRSGRGDYETMGMDIAKNARQFEKEYSPIASNAKRYAAYKQRLQEAYEKGPEDGGINEETYRRSLAKSVFGYEGLQKSADGTIDDDSFFSGFNFVKDVDIQGRMSDLMKDMAVEKYGKESKVISQDGNYYITQGGSYERIPEADVAAVFNNLMSDPDVSAALRQRSELRTFDKGDEQIREEIFSTLYGDEADPENNGLIGLRDKAIQEGDDDMAARYDKQIKERQALLQDTGIESESEMIDKRKDYARNSVLNSEMERELGVSIRKFAFNNITEKFEQEYSQKWSIDYKNFVDNAQPNIFARTEVSEIGNPGGDSVNKINDYIAGQVGIETTEVDNFNTAYADQLGGRKVTAEDIISGNVPASLLDVLPGARERIITSRTMRGLQQALLDKAYKETGVTDEDLVKQTFGKYTGQQLLDEARKVTNNPNLTLEGLMEIRNDIGDLYGEQSFLESVNPFNTPTKIDPRILQDPSHPDYKKYQRALSIQNMFGKTGNATATLRSLNALVSAGDKNLDKVNDWIADNAKINVGDWTSNNFPDTDPKKATEATKFVNQYFTGSTKGGGAGKPLDKSFNIYWGGKKQSGTGTVASLIEDLDWQGSDVNVIGVSFDTSPYMGEPTIQLKVKGTDKDGNAATETVILPYSNIKNEQMDAYFDSPGYRLQLELNNHKVHQQDGAKIGMYDKETGKLSREFEVQFDPGRGDVVILDGQALPIGGQKFVRMLDTNAAKYDFRTIF
jgi:hypothetical protein